MNHLGAPARLRQLARLAILAQCLLAAFFVAGSYNAFTHLPKPTTTDFAAFYAAGVLADRGQAAGAYDRPAHQAVEEQVTAPGIEYKYYLNPPPFLLICAPLTHLPYLAAFLLFELATLALWLAVTLRIVGGGRLALLLLLATPSLYWAFGWGQNSFLTAGLMGLGTLLLRTRPGLAGAAFGALAIKPHFGVLLPVALLCGRQWRAIATAALTVITLVALSAAMFGVSSWRGFAEALRHSNLVQLSGHIDAGGAVRLLGASPGVGWAVQGMVSLAAAAAVAWAWLAGRRQAAPDLYECRMAALVAGTMAAMPFLLFYDLVMASVAAAWLAAAAQKTGWQRGEIRVLAVLFVLVLLDFPSAGLLHLAIGCFVAPALLWMAVKRLG